VNNNGKQVTRCLVHTVDIQSYIERLAEKGTIDLSDPANKVIIDIDDGKKSLKLFVNIISKGDIKEVRKNSGPHKSHLIACIYKFPETHANLMTILNKINNFSFQIKHKIIGNLKLANILCGISTNLGKHPCFISECFKLEDGSWKKGDYRTIESLNSYHCSWKTETNSNKHKVK
jgi:hypothetical protein